MGRPPCGTPCQVASTRAAGRWPPRPESPQAALRLLPPRDPAAVPLLRLGGAAEVGGGGAGPHLAAVPRQAARCRAWAGFPRRVPVSAAPRRRLAAPASAAIRPD